MSNPFSMFTEKQGSGAPLSMTRVVAFLFAVTYCVTLYTYGKKAFAINWPFAALGICTLLAVPLQAIFGWLQHWLASRPGNALLAKLVEKFLPGAGSTVASTVSSTVTTTPAPPDTHSEQ
jgi:hypothetical protein